MPADFTYGTYADLLDAAIDGDYEFVTMREYFGRTALPDRFVILRHDVDRKAENALDFARIEADRGVTSTYYVRTINKTFDPDMLRELESLGHEVGYHYEDVDRAGGDVDLAHESFATQLERMREYVAVATVCMHGNPLTSHDNRDMWVERDPAEYDLLGEAYLGMDFTDVTYFSDTGRTWRDGRLKVKDNPVGDAEKDRQVDSTPELMALLAAGDLDRVCLLSHPNRWADSRVELAVEATKDLATNAGKHAIQTAGLGRGIRRLLGS